MELKPFQLKAPIVIGVCQSWSAFIKSSDGFVDSAVNAEVARPAGGQEPFLNKSISPPLRSSFDLVRFIEFVETKLAIDYAMTSQRISHRRQPSRSDFIIGVAK
jgi:hypothetical protein